MRVQVPIDNETPVKLSLTNKGIYLGIVRWHDADLVGVSFSVGQQETDPTAAGHAMRQRLHSRHETLWRGNIASAQGVTPCQILNLSTGGARILMSEPIAHDTLVTLSIESIGEVRGQIAWQIHEIIGITFFAKAAWLVEQLVDGLQPSEAIVSPRQVADPRRI